MISPRCLIVILACFFLSVQAPRAQETVGQEDLANHTDQTFTQVSESSILEYLESISEREQLYGPYDPQLSEQLLGLGLLYKNMGKYDEAGEVLKRSLHIRKVNDGIQSMTQVPVLEALIEVNTNAHKWDDLNTNHHLLLWVHQRNLESGDPSILPVIERVGRWKLAAYARGLLSEEPSTTLNDIINIYETITDIMTDQYGENDPRLIVPLRGLSLMQYQLVQHVLNKPLDEFQGIERKEIIRNVCTLVLMPDGVFRRVCRPTTVPNPNYYVNKQHVKNTTLQRHLYSVRDTLKRIVEISTPNNVSPFEQAVSLVNLGDWYFINQKRQTAFKYYRNAYQLLDENGTKPEQIDALLGKPVRIPVMSSISPDPDENTEFEIPKPFIRIAFDVPTDGKARRIRIIEESNPKNYKARKIAKQQIRNSLFRPRFQDGEPVATQEAEILLYGALLENLLNKDPRRENPFASITDARIRR